MQLKVALLGCGIGRLHLQAYRNLPELFDLRVIGDIDEYRGQALADEFGVPRTVPGLAELCQMDELDVIDICTPSHLHYQHARQALAAGKHVICEKPLAGSLQEVDALARLEAESGRRLMPIFQYRFGRGLQKLKGLVAAGMAGPAYLSTAEVAWNRGPDYYAVPWRGRRETELGGALTTHAIHALDMLTYVLGPIHSLFARAATRVNPIETEDCAVVSLELADGSFASLAVTLGSAVEISRHRFCFRDLAAESNQQPYASSADPWTFTPNSPAAAERLAALLNNFAPLPEGYAGQFYRFYHALRNGAELPVTLADARQAIEALTAMYYSIHTGQPVRLPIGRGHPFYAGWFPDRSRAG